MNLSARGFALVGIPLAVLGTFAVACGSSEEKPSAEAGEKKTGASGSQGDFGSGGPSDGVEGAGATADECKKMDIVFIVDDSNSMEQEQSNLATNFPKFASVIDQYKTKSGANLDYRLAVTTTKTGKTQGTFASKRGASAPKNCDAGPERPWLERADGAVADMFSCRAQVGTDGGSPEQSLESVFLGLTDRIEDGTNNASDTSFLRADALLAFVAITDEDEGGTEGSPAREVSEYPALFDGIKGSRERWSAAVIAGEKKCSSKGLGEAAEAKRLKQFIADVGKNGVFSSLCTGDLTDGLTKALETFGAACKSFPTGPK
jgi:hypothetical protein